MKLGRMVAVIADVHGAHGTLTRALAECRVAGVDTVVLLGDLIDRPEQADPCASALCGWEVIGVYGNHEREIALAAARRAVRLRDETVHLLGTLQERVVLDDVCLTHEATDWGLSHQLPELLRAPSPARPAEVARITFAGHTHYRAARDERGPLDLGQGTLVLDDRRRYLINPGALEAGQFAIWDRAAGVITFRQLGS